ncbi:MAG: septum formation initiator family protein [Patescibacteria group bacterium]
MKIFLVAISILLITALSFELYSLWGRNRAATSDLQQAQKKLQEVKIDQNKLKAELNYLVNPINLEKEVRSRFNLKLPGEKAVIIIPKTTSTTSTPN